MPDPGQGKQRPGADGSEAEYELQTFLQELRVIIPGTQMLGGFLVSVPFQSRYETLSTSQRGVYLVTFLTTMLALSCFLAPAVYHRLAAPVRQKRKFATFGTRMVVIGFVPLTISTALSTHLVVSMVLGNGWASLAAATLVLLLLGAWWIAPRLRLHERMADRDA